MEFAAPILRGIEPGLYTANFERNVPSGGKLWATLPLTFRLTAPETNALPLDQLVDIFSQNTIKNYNTLL